MKGLCLQYLWRMSTALENMAQEELLQAAKRLESENQYLQFRPGQLYRLGIIAPLPDFPIKKGIAGAGLLAQIMVDKYVDHLPIYRQVQRFARENVRIPAITINGWQDSIFGQRDLKAKVSLSISEFNTSC